MLAGTREDLLFTIQDLRKDLLYFRDEYPICLFIMRLVNHPLRQWLRIVAGYETLHAYTIRECVELHDARREAGLKAWWE